MTTEPSAGLSSGFGRSRTRNPVCLYWVSSSFIIQVPWPQCRKYTTLLSVLAIRLTFNCPVTSYRRPFFAKVNSRGGMG
ncbi:hypothetical protein GDO81_013981 [Engystomops pustulosus]|uniref:Uncharacterized protein n=1 Tax=Engystomops pustulosus TaxID=76066 RepID=A0AAV7B782_ENGPU|nr:hypothetical protein GDO81_013981 [Engystomops pustulosus]